MRRGAVAVVAALTIAGVVFAATSRPTEKREPLPQIGTALSDFPEAPGVLVARAACLQCHSADMVRQQRLTEKQWNAELDKMVKWGAALKDEDRPALFTYLSSRFGPENASFQPAEAAPISVPAQ
jgi:mono/diheme cytochrome c family protein